MPAGTRQSAPLEAAGDPSEALYRQAPSPLTLTFSWDAFSLPSRYHLVNHAISRLLSSACHKLPEACIRASRQLYWSSGQPAPHLLPPKAANVKTGTFNLTKGQAFVSDLLLTGETAVVNASDPKQLRCDALALEGGPGGQPKVQLFPFLHANLK